MEENLDEFDYMIINVEYLLNGSLKSLVICKQYIQDLMSLNPGNNEIEIDYTIDNYRLVGGQQPFSYHLQTLVK